MGGEGVEDFAGGVAGGNPLLIGGEDGQGRVPPLGEGAGSDPFEFGGEVGMGVPVGGQVPLPGLFPLFTDFEGFAEVLEDISGDEEAGFEGPAERFFCTVEFFVARGFAVGFFGTRAGGQTVTDDGAAENERGTGIGFGGFEGEVNGFDIVAIGENLGVPAVGVETGGAVLGEGEGGVAFDGDVVVVVEVDEFAEAEVPGEGGGFGGDAFHEVAVGDDGVSIMVNEGVIGLVEPGCEVGFSYRHADAVGKALPERAGGHFDAGGEAVFGVAGGDTAPLAEVLDLFEGEVVTGEVEEGIEEHGAMSAGEDEAVAVEPVGVGGVVAEVAHPNRVGHGRTAHRQSGVAGVGFLDGIGGEETNSVEGAGEKFSGHGSSL